jgi:hypothetical protein
LSTCRKAKSLVEVGFAKVDSNKVWIDIWMFLSPPIPNLYALFEQIEVSLAERNLFSPRQSLIEGVLCGGEVQPFE